MSDKNNSVTENTMYMGYKINEIRFLPMSKEIFPTYAEVSEFLNETLPKRGGVYFYLIYKMNCPSNTLVLFQYKGELIGSAICLLRTDFDKPMDFGDGDKYWGSYSFAVNSIQIFEKPIDYHDYSNINPVFRAFCSAPQIVPIEYFTQIIDLIESKKPIKANIPIQLPEEVIENEVVLLKEGTKSKIIVNAYERNSQARDKCLSHYKKKNGGAIKCEICGFDFGKIYGEQFSDKIHVHHLLELSAIGEEYVVDPINDLLPICPNCHLIAHSRTPAYKPKEIKEMLKNK